MRQFRVLLQDLAPGTQTNHVAGEVISLEAICARGDRIGIEVTLVHCGLGSVAYVS